jgi:hypothetical protein
VRETRLHHGPSTTPNGGEAPFAVIRLCNDGRGGAPGSSPHKSDAVRGRDDRIRGSDLEGLAGQSVMGAFRDDAKGGAHLGSTQPALFLRTML